jgi:tetratricopeptide (TPR) repeat protein
VRRTARVLVLLLLSYPVAVFAHPGDAEKIAILTHRIEAQPGDQRPYIARGAAYSHDGQYELALADFRKAEGLGESVGVAYELGVLQYRIGKLDAARTYLDTFLKRFPNHPPALEQRAYVLADLGEPEAAVAAFETLFAAQPRPNPGLYVSASKLLAAQGETGVEPALAMLDRGMERLGVIPQLQQYAIELELRRQKPAKAIDRLKTLEPALGEGPDWKVAMGELLLLDDRPDEAGQLFDEALAQLETLRKTAARQRTLKKLQMLRASMGERS